MLNNSLLHIMLFASIVMFLGLMLGIMIEGDTEEQAMAKEEQAIANYIKNPSAYIISTNETIKVEKKD